MKKIIYALALGISISSTLALAGMPGEGCSCADLAAYCDRYYSWSPARHAECMSSSCI